MTPVPPLPRSSLSNMGRSLTSRGAWAFVLALFLLVGIAVLDDYGVAWDDPTQRNIAKLNADYISGKDDNLQLRQKDKHYGIAFELPLLWIERALGLEDTRNIYLSRHLLIHLFFLLGAACCYLLALRLFNNRILALAAMLLFLLHPRLYAHSFLNSKDIPFFSMFMITLLLIHRAFVRDTVRAFLLCGAAVAVLINLRVMGVMLWIAVIIMRGLDVWYAEGRQERIRVLKTLGGFILSSVLTLYAVWPYLWKDPFGRLVEAFTIASHYPNKVTELFKGEFFSGFDLPWEYLPTWFLITTPWVALLLGLIGIVAVGYRGLARPSNVLRNTPLRFQWLLLACFILPVLAVMLLGSTLHDGWRHMYFIYAPFCLLAAYGLHQLVSPSRKKYWRVGVYALTGIGLVGVVIEMVQIHPYQNVYFNALVDRHTPEYLRTQYEMDYWGTSYREGLEYLLEHYPDSPVRVYRKRYSHADINSLILPATERRRIVFDDDTPSAPHFAMIFFHNDTVRDDALSSPYFAMYPMYPTPSDKEELIHTIKIYNNTILAVYAVNLDLLPDEQAFYRNVYHKTKTRKPVIRSFFDVYWYRGGGGLPHHDSAVEFRYTDRLVYIRESCHPDDLKQRFFLHIFPKNRDDDLPDSHRPHDSDNLDFDFFQYGRRVDGKCMVVVPLPEYDMDYIRTGQYGHEGELWSGGLKLQTETSRLTNTTAWLDNTPWREIISGKPAIDSAFDVYLDENRLIYFKQPCAVADTRAEFFLNIYSEDTNNLSDRKDGLIKTKIPFYFPMYGKRFDDQCVAVVPLPEVDIVRIRTGQRRPGPDRKKVWKGKFSLK